MAICLVPVPDDREDVLPVTGDRAVDHVLRRYTDDYTASRGCPEPPYLNGQPARVDGAALPLACQRAVVELAELA
jgi:hypothetical protein